MSRTLVTGANGLVTCQIALIEAGQQPVVLQAGNLEACSDFLTGWQLYTDSCSPLATLLSYRRAQVYTSL